MNLVKMFFKSLVISAVILLGYSSSFSQSGFPYDKEWSLVDSLMNRKNLPKSALLEVNKMYDAAKKDKLEAQWIKAIIYKNHLDELNDQDINREINNLEKEIANAPVRVASVLKSVEAEQLFQYAQENLYQIRNRTEVVGDTSADISTWTIGRLNRRIRILYLSYLDNASMLQQTKLNVFDPVIIKGNTRELRPTLYDLLAWRALDYFRIDYRYNGFADDDQLSGNPYLFSDARFFMHVGFVASDSLSNAVNAIRIYQLLLRFHSKDLRQDAWLDADISRIQYANQIARMPEKDSLYLSSLVRVTNQFGSLSASSKAGYLQALWWSDKAAAFDPLKDTSHRFDNLKAIDICNQVKNHPDSSEGKSDCEQLLASIKRSSFSLNIERVNIPALPFRALVTYKNVSSLHFRIIHIDDAARESFEQNNYDSKSWAKWLRMPYVRNFSQLLPQTGDYQQHRVEIKINETEAGQYALLVSNDSTFSDKAFLGLSTFFISNIAYVANGQDFFVLHRITGRPLQNVKVKTYVQKNTNKGYEYVMSRSYLTDANGFFHLQSDKQYGNLKTEFYNGSDYLSTVQYVNFYRNGEIEADKNKLTDFLFTDRSIYRPGQTVFFKGLLMSRDVKTRKYKVATQEQSVIYLLDVNEQKIDSLMLKSSDFGSIHGSFKLPVNLINGTFQLTDEKTGDRQSFSVEEYKRPSFYVEFDSLKGSYRVGDTIRIKSSALAYSGSTIGDASVTWRVYREARFPYPWLFRVHPSRSNQEIAHGVSSTDADGKFDIHFTAIPDLSIDKATIPVFTFRVEADITDVNGESRSASTSVDVSYQSFEILSQLPLEGSIPRGSLKYISVTTVNSAKIFIKEQLKVSAYTLESPGRLIRKRYWDQPDQFALPEKEYVQYFPHDEYRNETDVKSWKKGMLVFERTDSSRSNGLFATGDKKLLSVKPGWYLFEFSATDLNGEEILDKKYIEITAGSLRSENEVYNLATSETLTGEPGATVGLKTGTDAKDVFVIRTRTSLNDTASKYSFYNLSAETKHFPIEIKESDRGGFAVNDVFIKDNRWYTCVHDVVVPWTNKELNISYLSWKDKTLPGSPELWKIKVSGEKKDFVMAEVLTSMYDASLDQFKSHAWNMPDIYPVYAGRKVWDDNNNFDQVRSDSRAVPELAGQSFFQNNYDALLSPDGRNVGYNRGNPTQRFKGVQMRGAPGGGPIVMDMALPEMVKFSAPKIVKDGEETAEPKPTANPASDNPKDVQIRKNINETAFFQPDLKTDAQGNLEISFTMPDALTRWKWMIFANTKDLSFGYSEKEIITQKELMLQTNMPRFFREGDTMNLPVKISNLSSQMMSGTIQLQLLDANTNQPIDRELGNLQNSLPFSVNASQSSVVFFPATIPAHFTKPVLYRIVARTNKNGNEYSDGEENIIPVLSNRMLVTESLPLNMNGETDKQFKFEKLLNAPTGGSLQNQSLTVEYTTNPSWYAVQSLPYLMEFPYECAEQTFNRFYANALAAHIVSVSPALQAVFNKWKNTDTAALLSNLQKNEELKSVLLQETPWVLEAQSETQQKKNLALLFDMIKMQQSLKSTLGKLQQMQSEGGGFAWFKGGRDDRYITQYILTAIGRLKKLKAIPADMQIALDKIARSGIAFVDKELKSDYEKRDKSPKAQNLDALQIQYLYMRSFYPDVSIPGSIFTALHYYRNSSVEKWTKQSVYMQGMIALFLSRTGDTKTAKNILASLKENATESAELGMYWKTNRSGYYWQEAPVETQSLLIEVFQEMHADMKSIDQMKYWLLQQKRTTHWPTTKATADACYALLINGSDWLFSNQTVSIQLGNYKINSNEEKADAGTGYFKKQIPGDQVTSSMGNIEIQTINGQRPTANALQPSTVNRQPPTANGQPPTANGQPSWGAVYWQYFEDLDKITSANTQLSLTKNLFIEKNSDKGAILESVSVTNVLKPGDKLKMRIIVKSDRDLEYVHLKDMRAACLEPVNVLSGYQWQGGLGYYQTTKDASTSFFFDRLAKGTYVFEYPVFVTTAGNYSNGVTILECMYAPEFAAHSEGVRIHVETK